MAGFHEIVTLFSLWLTPMTIIACGFVVYKFYEGFKKSIKIEQKTDLQWFIIGIVIGFVGDFSDNLYWGLAWTADYLQLASRDALFDSGVYSNSIFRQGCGFVSALCHLSGISDVIKKESKEEKLPLVKKILISGSILGTVLVALLLLIK